MFFLHNHKGWTAALFERICTLFGWDDRKGIFPEPEFIWRHLIERCEKYAYFEHWQRLVASEKTDTVEEKAAMLVLKPGRRLDRLRLARLCSADVWSACERLCSTINNRYPEMLERFPEADLQAWRELQVSPMLTMVWIWLGWILFALGFTVPDAITRGQMTAVEAPIFILFYTFMMTAVCTGLARIWNTVSRVVEVFDEKLSERLLPQWLNWPGYQALVLRHGIPLILTGAAVSIQGYTALLCYSLLMLAWIFLSPYRHPQVYAAAREAIKRFLHINKGKLLLSAGVIVVAAILMGIYPPERHDLRVPNAGQTLQTAPAHQLNCLSDQAIALMDKECQNSLMPERCANYTREQKISQCFVLQNQLQGAPAKASVPAQ